MTQVNTVTHTYSYDALNRLRTLNVARGATVLHAYEYKLNAAGHRREVIEGAKTTTYTYDGVYRLTNESIAADPNANNGAIGYGLDKVGNRLSRSSSVATIQNQIGSFNARDWLTGDTYTANGSTIQGATALAPVGSTTDTYDFEERLILRTRTDGTSLPSSSLTGQSSPIRRRSTGSQPRMTALTSSRTGIMSCRRLNASSWAVTAAVRSAALRMYSTSVRTSAGRSWRRSTKCAAPSTTLI